VTHERIEREELNLSALRKRGVVAIAPLPPPSGGQTACARMFLRALEEVDVPVSTIDLSRPFRPGPSRLRRASDAAMLMRSAWQIDRAIQGKSRRPLVYIHLGWGRASMLRDQLLLASPLARHLPIVGHVHGGRFRENFDALPRPARAVHAALLRRLAVVIVLTEGLRGMFDGILPAERVSVVENAVEPSLAEFARQLPARIPPKKTMRVLFLSHLIEDKGYEDFLLAAAEAHRRQCPMRFTLAGERTEHSHIDPEVFIAENCPETAHWVGGADPSTRQELLRSHDVFVLPSRVEGVPLVLLEAMHAGLPIVTTPIGGIPEIIERGENGLFIDIQRPDQIVDRLQWLMDHPDAYLAMSERNQKRARERYDPRRHERDLLKIMGELANAENA
jgi:glycosyltransferase involved in cell wall biosynthesis